MNKLMDSILEQINCIENLNASELGKIANRNYKKLPSLNDDFISISDLFISSNNWHLFNIATLWLKRRKSAIDIKYFKVFEKWIKEYIYNWGMCDQLCYRVINPLVEKYDELYKEIISWSRSDNKNVRRISLVCMIRSTGKLTVYYDFDRVIHIVEKLKTDEDIHVQKAVGWVLKCSYKNYPEQVVDYLKINVKNLSRLIFRYALENMPKEIKKEMMSLEYK